ncbi:hypothetical protein AJ80_07674 [Polytolypa hystricis UAMH7299]|uniref:Beta-xylanase n=1 Tax=Polytolypa hystricis (strain UAMH7299) TaxID=1447883 RepID=A0A2B7XL19_POLH7|nr:hypothetical protein AJ80_07674 [Polytolypa hystricis UAMH7299]
MVNFSSCGLLALVASLVSADGLNTRAEAAGKYFGTATDNPTLSDSVYIDHISNPEEFGQITVGNAQKWDATEPSRGNFNFANGDQIADLAAGNGQFLRCHTLVWHSQLPSWVSNGNFDNATLISIMENHIANVAGHYKGKCVHWDVVNEALNEDGTYRDSVFYRTIGEAFLPIAFKAAAAADPNAKLYYNDYNLDHAGAKSSGAQRIVNLIKSYGVKIDGVGLQGHLIVGNVGSSSALASNLNDFTSLDVDVAYTELDIRTETPASDSALQQQATDYGNVVTACKSVSRCLGITVWDATDKYSWIPSVFPGEGDALPWDENYQKKPAYYAMLDAWGGGGTSPPSSTTSVTGPTSTPTDPGQVVPHWGQCGGIGYDGPTTCESPYTCMKSNDWYSQCL